MSIRPITQRFLLFALVFLVSLTACKKKEPEKIPVASITMSETSIEMKTGDSIILSVTIQPYDATDKTVIWSSSEPSVVTVKDGLLYAVAAGTAMITAEADGKVAWCTVKVIPSVIGVERVSLDTATATLTEGETITIIATVTPEDATDKTVTWSTSDANVATVDNGIVSALSAGTAIITAKAGDKTASCTVTVQKLVIPVESVELNKTELSLIEGESETLTATVYPDNATDKTVSWRSSNNSVATVSDYGEVVAVREGMAIISASSGGIIASCSVVVQKKVIPVTSVSLNQNTLDLYEGESQTLSATVLPKNATDKTITWQSSNVSVAKVENGKVTALSIGEATISAIAGEKSATCKVTVKPKPLVSSITLSERAITGYINNYFSFSITVAPANAQYSLECVSSDTRVAEVQGSGLSRKIYTKDFGKAVITVQDKLSGKSASITVETLVTDFGWQENTGSTYSGYPLITIKEGDEYQLHYSCSPSSATHLFEDLSNFVFYEPTYVVDTPSVISISPDGKVTGLKVGTVGIKPTGLILKGSSGNDRVYIKVIAKTVAVSEVLLDRYSLNMRVGASETLTATVKPDNATDKTVSWSTSDASVATVSNGVVTAKKIGTATITAKAGDKTATCTVTVAATPVTSVTLSQTTASLKEGETLTLTATVKPDDATDKTVTWSTSDASVATVNQSGVVTAVKKGTATITAQAGDKTATCVFTIEDNTFSLEPIGYEDWN